MPYMLKGYLRIDLFKIFMVDSLFVATGNRFDKLSCNIIAVAFHHTGVLIEVGDV